MCMCTRTCMATKTITIMDDAYNLLLSRKNNNESFSEVIRKMAGKKGDIMRLAGAWKHLTSEEVEKRKSDIRKLRKESTKELLNRINRLNRLRNNDLH